MNRENAKQYVKEHLEDYLRQKGIDTSRNFQCLNPDHPDVHPSMAIDRGSRSGPHCKCFACGAYYDTFDVIGLEYGLSDAADKFKKAYEIFNLQTDGNDDGSRMERTTAPQGGSEKSEPQKKGQDTNAEESQNSPDFTEALKEAHRELLKTPEALEYLKSRGLTMEIINTYEIGYDSLGYNHVLRDHTENMSGSKKVSLYRYVFPFPDADGRCRYFLSEITDRKKIDGHNGKYRKITGIKARFFNERYIQFPPSVTFVCEGIYDALSVELAGGKAIGLIGIGHKRFLDLCKRYQPKTTFVISLDNDSAGNRGMDRVKEGLDALKIPYIVRTAPDGKDFNEALTAYRGNFMDFIKKTEEEAKQKTEQEAMQEKQAYLQTSAAYKIQGLRDWIEKSKTAAFFPTGFSKVDSLLDGGLYPGSLYIVGAISSLGKTTFCLQILDNIAAAGRDVMIFSLEMAEMELMAKSISRLTFLASRITDNIKHAKTTRGILTGTRYASYSSDELNIIETAFQDYRRYSEHVFINEGIGDIGAEQIREAVEQHEKLTGNKPVVLIDYVQILAPRMNRATDKQNVDKAVTDLKRMSRDLSIPVIGISSFNRENYMAPVNMTSFKESGAVEYSSDVLIGLQYKGMDYEATEKENVRQNRVRELIKEQIEKGGRGLPQTIQVKVLKNRNGSKGDALLDFYPMFNYFQNSDVSADDKSNVSANDKNDGWHNDF